MKALLVLFAVFLVHCTTINNIVPDRDDAVIDSLQSSTVALVRAHSSGIYASDLSTRQTYCTGVWVSRVHILTANHCAFYVRNEEMKLEDKYYVAVGDEILFSALNDVEANNIKRVRSARVVSQSTNDDLALLIVSEDEVPNHSWVRLSTLPISKGMRLHIMGHPDKCMWTYMQGYVANDSKMQCVSKVCDQINTHVINVISSITYGSSGGGAYDVNGNLVSIASFMSVTVPNMSMFVHRDVIAEFIRRSIPKSDL